MKRLKRISLLLAVLCVISLVLSSCDIIDYVRGVLTPEKNEHMSEIEGDYMIGINGNGVTINRGEGKEEEGEDEEDLSFVLLDDGTYAVASANSKKLKNIEIPAKYDGKKVTGILDNAFEGMTKLKTVSIPDSVKYIGNGAFEDCTNLSAVEIGPKSKLEVIGEDAFYGCESLEEIYLPAGIEEIGQGAFTYCLSLTVITFEGDMEKAELLFRLGVVSSRFDVKIDCPDGHYYIHDIVEGTWGVSESPTEERSESRTEGKSESGTWAGPSETMFETTPETERSTEPSYEGVVYQIVEGVSEAKHAEVVEYNGDASVVAIYSEYNGYPVTKIANEAFSYSNMTSVIIPDTVKKIGSDAFANCTSLTSVNIPDSVMNIGANAFINCYRLKTYYNNVYYVDGWAVECDAGLGEVSLREGTRGIAGYAFESSANCLSSIYIPDGVKTMSGYAFYNCTAITAIDIGDGVEYIGDYAFGNCYYLVSINWSASANRLGYWLFQGCNSLERIYYDGEISSAQNHFSRSLHFTYGSDCEIVCSDGSYLMSEAPPYYYFGYDG